jgi:hypothetical protein
MCAKWEDSVKTIAWDRTHGKVAQVKLSTAYPEQNKDPHILCVPSKGELKSGLGPDIGIHEGPSC